MLKASCYMLWKRLIDEKNFAAKLHNNTGNLSGSLTTDKHSESVLMKILWRLRAYLGCNIVYIVESEFACEEVAK